MLRRYSRTPEINSKSHSPEQYNALLITSSANERVKIPWRVETVADLRNFLFKVQPKMRNPVDAFLNNFFAGLFALMEPDFLPHRALEGSDP